MSFSATPPSPCADATTQIDPIEVEGEGEHVLRGGAMQRRKRRRRSKRRKLIDTKTQLPSVEENLRLDNRVCTQAMDYTKQVSLRMLHHVT